MGSNIEDGTNARRRSGEYEAVIVEAVIVEAVMGSAMGLPTGKSPVAGRKVNARKSRDRVRAQMKTPRAGLRQKIMRDALS
jgi:hypothetical protein